MRPLGYFKNLPKADLHVHLDGSLRVETLLELAQQQKVELGARDVASLRKILNCGVRTGSLTNYLQAFDVVLRVMQQRSALYRIAYELAEDAHREHVTYMEVRYCPALHVHQGLSTDAVMEAVLEGLAQAKKDFGMDAYVIVCALRTESPEKALAMAELAARFSNAGVVGFDLAGGEHLHPPEEHLRAFEKAKHAGLKITIHAGEDAGAASIANAVRLCFADRIGHGCRLYEDPALLEEIKTRGIVLECCPSSNVQTGVVTELQKHPLVAYHRAGVRVTVNTDNRLMSDTSVSKELWLCHTELGLETSALEQIIQQGFNAAFGPTV